MNNRMMITMALALLSLSFLVSRSDAADADGKLMLLEIRFDGKSMATAAWPEKVGAKPDSLRPYLTQHFMATRKVMPKPAKGTTVTLKGKVVIQLRWPSGKVLDAVELDRLTLTYATPDPAFPKETRWYLKDEETKRIRKVVDRKQKE